MRIVKGNPLTIWIAAVAVVVAVWAGDAQGAVFVRLTESGGNVVVTTSGSADTTQWGAASSTANSPRVELDAETNNTFISFGTTTQAYWTNAGAAGAFTFTDGGLVGHTYTNFSPTLTSGGGDVGFRGSILVWLPSGYTAGTAINQVLTLPGASFATLGVTDGQFARISWGGTNPDSITFVIGNGTPVELQTFSAE